jgi:hypothetical protein
MTKTQDWISRLMLTVLFLMFRILVIRDCFEFRISDFEFILINLRHPPTADYLQPGPRDQVFFERISLRIRYSNRRTDGFGMIHRNTAYASVET